MESYKSDFLGLEREVESGSPDTNGWRNWQDLKIKLNKQQRIVTKDLKQKSRVKWAVEGDENTK